MNISLIVFSISLLIALFFGAWAWRDWNDPAKHSQIQTVVTILGLIIAIVALFPTDQIFPLNEQEEIPTPNTTSAKEAVLATPPMVNGHEWVEIPAGKFIIGANDTDIFADLATLSERPQHELYLDVYWISKYETTNKQYKKFIDDGNLDERWLPINDSGFCNIWRSDGTYTTRINLDNHPVECVSWFGAQAYADWLNKQPEITDQSVCEIVLPSEAEWEKAARGPDNYIYPWGNTFNQSNLNSHIEGGSRGMPIGSFPAGVTESGIYDLAGNVWEWTRSQRKAYPYDNDDGREAYPSTDTEMIVRGGAFGLNGERYARTTHRGSVGPQYRTNIGGFRIACIQKTN